MSKSCSSSQEQKEPRGQQPPEYTKNNHMFVSSIKKAPNIEHGEIEEI
jgi:hypothetical protein